MSANMAGAKNVILIAIVYALGWFLAVGVVVALYGGAQ